MSLILERISKSFMTLGRRKKVFSDFSLYIPRGVNLGVIGPNGAGKSTMINMIAGAVLPDKGRIIRNMSISWPLGYSGGLNVNITGIDNCKFLARMYDRDPKSIVAFVRDFSGLEDKLDVQVKTYSSGMRSRLAFSLSMAIDFDCILIDEAMSAGDQFFREKSQLALESRRKNSTFIVVSHNMNEIVRLCDQVLVLGGPRPELCDDVRGRVDQYVLEMTPQPAGVVPPSAA